MAQPTEAPVTTRVIASRLFGIALVEVALGDVTAQEGFDGFGLLHLVEDKGTIFGVTFWVKYGKVVFDRWYC